jgi:class 3 adenylate cyclase
MRFCGECAQPLDAEAASATPVPPEPTSAAAAERRLVSVLFADLVGFTTLSEGRDAEEVRELLSRYFEAARTLIERYGGTVEKFIGDAVMAVWGTPTATEDDAERAVRAALELTSAVAALGEEVSAPELQARAGVLTGEAAVTPNAQGEGMVAGDLVNAASRVQAAAPPGQVYVGEATRRATAETIAFEEAGSHELKGKTGLVPLWCALRVVSGVRGSLKSPGLEAPFVGRSRELRLIKELFHACAEERKAHLFSVTGIAGIGKSRLGWEFYKYFDGLAETVYWHRGRCLAYGEGVTYWALADMVRMRARIAEDEEPHSALEKLRATLDEHILDPEDRRFVEPRLAHLLGLEEHEARERQDLFAAWRLFFERLAEVYPTVLMFEDMQWADRSLLDFIEYLLEWSRDHPLYVITLARPELLERRPTWGAGHRNFTSLHLEPLAAEAMQELLAGLVPGLPEELRAQILARAEGVPLYAVETVRMLLDRGLLVQQGSVYRPVGAIETLAVPETLHALIAARLDGLSADERRILQDGAVLGKTFTRQALAPPIGRGARAAAVVADAQGGALRAGRPALTRAWPVRLPSGSGQACGVRDPVEARAPRAPPRSRGLPGGGIPRGRGDRGGPGLTLPRGLSDRARDRGRRRDQGEGARDARAGRRARGLACRIVGRAALFRASGGACGSRAREGAPPRSSRSDGVARGRGRDGRAPLHAIDVPVRRRRRDSCRRARIRPAR